MAVAVLERDVQTLEKCPHAKLRCLPLHSPQDKVLQKYLWVQKLLQLPATCLTLRPHLHRNSLEDRIVKQAFRYLETDCICDKSLPVCVCGKVKEVEVLTKKPTVASLKEMTLNSRSKCAKLRIAEKIV